jgi:hypothetical protein
MLLPETFIVSISARTANVFAKQVNLALPACRSLNQQHPSSFFTQSASAHSVSTNPCEDILDSHKSAPMSAGRYSLAELAP